MEPAGDFCGKNVLITGASRGLGLAIARAFWIHGANLLLVARSANALDAIREEFLSSGPGGQEIRSWADDLSQPECPERILACAKGIWRKIDVLVNNAAIIGPIGAFWENDWPAWEITIRVNLLAPAAICRGTLGWMREAGGGAIVNISGGGATAPRPFFSAYASAKAGLVRLSETLARETAGSGIRVNCVAPGAMNTQMNAAVLSAGPAAAGVDEFGRARRLAESHAVVAETPANLALYLASPVAEQITGKLISAVWDPWRDLEAHAAELAGSDIYTLRRILPEDRGKTWKL